MFLGQVSIINRLNFTPVDFLHVATVEDPFGAQWRKALSDIAVKIWIAPGPARVVNAHRFVRNTYGRDARATPDLAVQRFRRRESYFAEWNADPFVQCARDINLLRVRRRSFDRINRIIRICVVGFFRSHFVNFV